MSPDSLPNDDDISPQFSPRYYGIGLLVIAIVAAGFWLIGRFNDSDRARDMTSWREKLNLIAESRTSDVDHWVNTNFKELRTLADNPSLQLYMSELQMMKSSDVKPDESSSHEEPSQKAYLRNLLLFTAQRDGFGAQSVAQAIPADVQPTSKNALAIIDSSGAMVVSTLMSPVTRDAINEHIAQADAGKEALIDIRKDKDGVPYIGFIVPVYSIQGDHNAAGQIGRVIGIKVVDNNVYDLLKHPGVTEKTLETILVRLAGDKLEYLSPLQDGTQALEKTAGFDNGKLAEAKLTQSSGDFVSDIKDYRDKTVLATSRQIVGTPWTLIVKIDRQEALAASDQRRNSMEVFFFLIIAIIVLIVIATWWRTFSKRAQALSGHFERMATQAVAQERLLRLVTDHQPEAIYIVDAGMNVHFANKQAGTQAHMSPGHIPGKNIWDIRGAAATKYLVENCTTALSTSTLLYHIERTNHGEREVITRTAFVPIDHIPIASLAESTEGVLLVEQDITELMHEREKRLKTQRQVIDMLVMMVDKRDPFAAHHSKLVSQIAYEIALEMELDTRTVETTSRAGSLMNIGKITVPTDLLTKTSPLSAEEKQTVHDSMNEAADFLDGISFDGPVADTLRQWQEKWDGSGPLGLKGEDILISARIIAVANAFVGMISPRAWRNAMSIEAASKHLLEHADAFFDHRVVVALASFMENHHGREVTERIMGDYKKFA